MAEAIAAVLGGVVKKNGYLETNNGIVTWQWGHILEMLEPDEYSDELKKWSLEPLPFIPKAWKMKVSRDKKCASQFKTIAKLVKEKRVKRIIHAGDPDREGQLLVDETLIYLNVKKPIDRLLVSSLDAKNVQRGLKSIAPNRPRKPIYLAGKARQEMDWLWGMNGTRAVTCVARDQNVSLKRAASIGRVQTAVLALVVKRDSEIEKFRSRTFFVPVIEVDHPAGLFCAEWLPLTDDDRVDIDGYLLDEKIANDLCKNASGQPGEIVKADYTPKKQKPPLGYVLSDLLAAASKKFKLSPSKVKAVIQSLYDNELISYPRSDCPYLPEEQREDAPGILAMLKGFGYKQAEIASGKCDVSRQYPVWNSKKVNAASHHAIVPTGQNPGNITDMERQIYDLIARRYIQFFYPEHEYEKQEVIVSCGGELWRATGTRVLVEGWKSV